MILLWYNIITLKSFQNRITNDEVASHCHEDARWKCKSEKADIYVSDYAGIDGTYCKAVAINEMKQSRKGWQNQAKDYTKGVDVLDPAQYFESSVVERKSDTPTETQSMECHQQCNLSDYIAVYNTYLNISDNSYNYNDCVT